MAKRLNKGGLHGVASSDIMSPAEPINRKMVTAAMAGKGLDGVLVSRLLNVERGAIYVPPSPDTTPVSDAVVPSDCRETLSIFCPLTAGDVATMKPPIASNART